MKPDWTTLGMRWKVEEARPLFRSSTETLSEFGQIWLRPLLLEETKPPFQSAVLTASFIPALQI